MPMIGIISALPIEAQYLKYWTDQNPDLAQEFVIKTTGINPKKTFDAAYELVKNGATALISWGTAGSIEKELEPGSIIIPEYIQTFSCVIKTSDDLNNKISEAITKKDKINSGNIVHTDTIIESTTQKRLLSAEFDNAVAIDMESFIIADCAIKAKIPFSAIRVIVDTYDTTMPRCIAKSITKSGRLSYIKLFANLACDIKQIKDLRILSEKYNYAKSSLKNTAAAIINHEN